MRHKGSISYVNIRRDKAAIALYRKAKRVVEWPTTPECIYKMAANLPVDEFYISPESAQRYVKKRMLNNTEIHFTNKYKQRLYNAMYEKVMKMMTYARYNDQPLITVVTDALATPAPCIGMSPRSLYMLCHKLKKVGYG